MDNCVREFWVSLESFRIRFLSCDPPNRIAAPGKPNAFAESKPPSRAGTPIVLLHGLLGYSFSWRHNMNALAMCAPVYALDLPGVGLSDRPRQMDRSFSGIARIVLRALDKLGIGAMDLVGTSHGGAVAMMLAATAPERIRKLVLVAPVHPWSRHGRWLPRLLSTAAGRVMCRGVMPCLSPLNSFFLRRMYGDSRRISAGTCAAYAAPVRIPGTREHLVELVRTWGADLRELERVLPRIAGIPTLLLWGNRDLAVPIQSAELLRQQFTNAKLVVIEGAGHLPYEEVPQPFNEAVCEFLAR